LKLGLATDGDGDRFGVVDGRGRVLSETQVVALLIDHLAVSGRVQRGVAITAGTGSLVEKVAAAHGLRVERHPIGFKHLSAAMQAGRVDVAGEESGGFALASMGLDKDGLLAGCLLANLVASSGEALEHHIERLEARFGRSACGRRAMVRTPERDLALDRLEASPPSALGGIRVVQSHTRTPLRLELEDGGFLMLRRSGTEPMIRLYAEAGSADSLAERLDAGQRLLEAMPDRS
jgi:phosphomannomutase